MQDGEERRYFCGPNGAFSLTGLKGGTGSALPPENNDERFALLYSDGSLSVGTPTTTAGSLRIDALESDLREEDPRKFTRLVRVRLQVIDEIETPAASAGDAIPARPPLPPGEPAEKQWRTTAVQSATVQPGGKVLASFVWPFEGAVPVGASIEISRP